MSRKEPEIDLAYSRRYPEAKSYRHYAKCAKCRVKKCVEFWAHDMEPLCGPCGEALWTMQELERLTG